MSKMKQWNRTNTKIQFSNTDKEIPDVTIIQEGAIFGRRTEFNYSHNGFNWVLAEDPSYVLEQWENSALTTEIHKAQANLRLLKSGGAAHREAFRRNRRR